MLYSRVSWAIINQSLGFMKGLLIEFDPTVGEHLAVTVKWDTVRRDIGKWIILCWKDDKPCFHDEKLFVEEELYKLGIVKNCNLDIIPIKYHKRLSVCIDIMVILSSHSIDIFTHSNQKLVWSALVYCVILCISTAFHK